MLTKSLAALVLASSLATVATGCGDRAPHIIQVPAQKAEPPAERPGQMTVTGQATLELSPDCADVSITIHVENDKTSSAVKQLEAKKVAMLEALAKAGIENGKVKLSSLGIDPVYAVNAQGYPTSFVRTYRAQITVIATTKDFAKISDIMDAGASAGATSMSTQYRRSDLAEQKQKVRDMALAAAKAKAEQTAKALGIKLGRVVSVAENAGGYMWGNQYFPSNMTNVAEARSAAVTIGGALQPLTLDVTIGYQLAGDA
jgi:uncharacterized protein YggE